MSALSEQVKDFLAETKRLRRPGTYQQYTYALGRDFVEWCHSQHVRDVHQLTDEVMHGYSDHLRSNDRLSRRGSRRPLAEMSVRTYLRIIQAFRHAHGVEGKFRIPRRRDSYPDPLSESEFGKLKAAATDAHDELVVTLIWETGLLASELLGLRKMDLREEPGPRTHLRIAADGRRERNVPIDPEVFERLRTFASAKSDREYIFVAETDRISRNNELGRLVDRLALQAGLRRTTKGRSGISPKLLRVSFTARWLSRGGNPIVLRKILGHSSLEMVNHLYARLADRDSFSEMMRQAGGG